MGRGGGNGSGLCVGLVAALGLGAAAPSIGAPETRVPAAGAPSMGKVGTSAPGMSVTGVSVTSAWSRATLPHQDDGVVYLTLRSTAGDVLTGAGCAEAGMAALHGQIRVGGMQTMQDLDSVPLPAGQDVALAPGGTHIMLMGMKHSAKPGETLHVTLHFARSGDRTVIVPVQPAGTARP